MTDSEAPTSDGTPMKAPNNTAPPTSAAIAIRTPAPTRDRSRVLPVNRPVITHAITATSTATRPSRMPRAGNASELGNAVVDPSSTNVVRLRPTAAMRSASISPYLLVANTIAVFSPGTNAT